MPVIVQRPSSAFIGASWAALFIGSLGFLIMLWNAERALNEKGFYFVVLMYGLFAAVSLQKSVRDRLEGHSVTALYFGMCWASIGICGLSLLVGLWNAPFGGAEKGMYAMSFLLALFGAVAVQKNVRDLAIADRVEQRSRSE